MIRLNGGEAEAFARKRGEHYLVELGVKGFLVQLSWNGLTLELSCKGIATKERRARGLALQDS